MTGDRLSERITEQFSGRGPRADIWRGFDLVLDTDAFLNLGYSAWYQPHVIGSSQRRLAAEIGNGLANRFTTTRDVTLLDVGCGRGGPAIHLGERFGLDVTGVDLVRHNVARATDNARQSDGSPGFVVGDAARLPFAASSFTACTAIDAIVYVPEKTAVFAEMSRVVRDNGLVAVSDLTGRDGLGPSGEAAVDAFADAWDMPPLPSLAGYREAMEAAGLTVEGVRDIGPNSIDRFRKWTWLYLGASTLLGPLLARLLARGGINADAVEHQIRRAHDALPHLRHVIVFARA